MKDLINEGNNLYFRYAAMALCALSLIIMVIGLGHINTYLDNVEIVNENSTDPNFPETITYRRTLDRERAYTISVPGLYGSVTQSFQRSFGRPPDVQTFPYSPVYQNYIFTVETCTVSLCSRERCLGVYWDDMSECTGTITSRSANNTPLLSLLRIDRELYGDYFDSGFSESQIRQLVREEVRMYMTSGGRNKDIVFEQFTTDLAVAFTRPLTMVDFCTSIAIPYTCVFCADKGEHSNFCINGLNAAATRRVGTSLTNEESISTPDFFLMRMMRMTHWSLFTVAFLMNAFGLYLLIRGRNRTEGMVKAHGYMFPASVVTAIMSLMMIMVLISVNYDLAARIAIGGSRTNVIVSYALGISPLIYVLLAFSVAGVVLSRMLVEYLNRVRAAEEGYGAAKVYTGEVIGRTIVDE
jgi:hypothetical protein